MGGGATTQPSRARNKPGRMLTSLEENGAGEAIRTPDPNLGKLPSRLFYAFRFYAKMPSNI